MFIYNTEHIEIGRQVLLCEIHEMKLLCDTENLIVADMSDY